MKKITIFFIFFILSFCGFLNNKDCNAAVNGNCEGDIRRISEVPDISIRAIATRENTIYIGSDNGIYAFDLINKDFKNLGLEQVSINSILINEDSNVILAGTKQSNNPLCRSEDGGGTWEHVENFSFGGSIAALSGKISHSIFAAFDDVFVSKDQGLTWRNTGPQGCWITRTLISSEDTIYWGGEKCTQVPFICYSFDGGRTWKHPEPSLETFFGGDEDAINSIAVDESDPKHILAGSEHYVIESFDAGLSWNIIDQDDAYHVFCWIDPDDSRHFLTVKTSTIPKYTRIVETFDGGNSWQTIGEISDASWTCLMKSINSSNSLFVGTERGLYVAEFDNEPPISIDFPIESPRPQTISLSQNYPNPFNNSTKITFSIHGREKIVNLRIYNIRGELIKTLVEQVDRMGEFTVQWDGGDKYGAQIPTGVYFLQLLTDKYSITKKLIYRK